MNFVISSSCEAIEPWPPSGSEDTLGPEGHGIGTATGEELRSLAGVRQLRHPRYMDVFGHHLGPGLDLKPPRNHTRGKES